MILYRPVGLQELGLIYDGGMKTFPARLPQQPIFYPVLQLEYARQIASGWNTQSRQFAGYITQFKIEDQYIDRFEEHTVGGSDHQEYWIQAEEVDEFNRHIVGHIKVLEAYFGDGFQGFIPENFGLQGKNAVEQFTLLSNSYIYKRMDFYLEIKRNHKAVFLNYPFWLKYDFKNKGLKEKVLQAIKEAWLTSFPKTPLANPVPEDATPVRPAASPILVKPADDDLTPVKHITTKTLSKNLPEEIIPEERINSEDTANPTPQGILPVERADIHVSSEPGPEKIPPVQPQESHFSQGLKLGLDGKYQEAIAELSKAVNQKPGDVVSRVSLGVAFHKAGEDDRAISCYDAALKIDPKYAEAHYFRANILYNRGDIPGAIAEYTSAVGLKPELIEAHQGPTPQDRLTDYTHSASEIYRIAKPAYRILDLNKMLEANPQQANLLKERAAEYARLGNYEHVIMDYSSSLGIEPGDARALYSRGLAYEQIGQVDRALEDYQQAAVNDPHLSDAFIERGVTYGKMGNFRQSVASLNEGIRLAPRNPNAYFNRGMTYLQQGDFESAINDFSTVIQLSPNDEDAYYWRGISNEEAGRQQDAISDYRQFLRISENPRIREEIEQKLNLWNQGWQNDLSSQTFARGGRQKTNQTQPAKTDRDFDLSSLILALDERALHSIWFANQVDCYGENAQELSSLTDHNQPIEGKDFLRITSGIQQTVEGDFYAFDPGASTHWIFIRAWRGTGFYVETDDRKIKRQLKARFQTVEEVEDASPPYEGLFIGK